MGALNKFITACVLLLLLSLLSAWIGGTYTANKYDHEIDKLQAEMSINSLKSYKRISLYLRKKCINSAEDYVEILLREKKMILSEYFNDGSGASLKEFIKSKDSDLHDEITGYAVDWSSPQKVAACK